MASRRRERNTTAGKSIPAANIEKLVAGIVGALPVVDGNGIDRAVAEVKARPRASLHYLFESFASADAPTRAVVARVIAACGGADVVDNLNAIIFDATQDAWTKVLANDLLGELDHPVDPEVFAMSVPDAERLQRKLPSRTLRLLAEGDLRCALEHARSLEQADRCMMILAAARRLGERAQPFLSALAEEDAANAFAAVGAIASLKLAAGVPLLIALQHAPNKPLQKLVKKTLFELRKAGIEVPEEKPRVERVPSEEVADDALPVYRAMMTDPSPRGLVLVIVARARPNGRLKMFSALMNLWKQGIQEAAARVDMSKSSFDRFAASQHGTDRPLKKVTLEACRRVVARGLRVSKELGSPIPADFGLGKHLLGDVEAEAAAIENPFLCSECGRPLEADAVAKIRATAHYDNIPVETRCATCRAETERT